MKALKFIINGEEQEIGSKEQELHPICVINVEYDSEEYRATGTVSEGDFVDGAIIILSGIDVPIDHGELDVIVGNKTRTLQIFPIQNGRLYLDGNITGLLRLNVGEGEDRLFHWEGGEWGPMPQ